MVCGASKVQSRCRSKFKTKPIQGSERAFVACPSPQSSTDSHHPSTGSPPVFSAPSPRDHSLVSILDSPLVQCCDSAVNRSEPGFPLAERRTTRQSP